MEINSDYTLEYSLTGAGWASLKIFSNNNYIDCTVSYLYDTFSDLLNSGIDLLSGKLDANVHVVDEPGEYKLCLRNENSLLKLKLFHSEDWNPKDEEYTLLLDFDITLKQYIRAITASAKSIYEKYGIEGYEQKWIEHPFPVNELNQLVHLSEKAGL